MYFFLYILHPFLRHLVDRFSWSSNLSGVPPTLSHLVSCSLSLSLSPWIVSIGEMRRREGQGGKQVKTDGSWIKKKNLPLDYGFPFEVALGVIKIASFFLTCR